MTTLSLVENPIGDVPWGTFVPEFRGRCVTEWGYQGGDGKWVEDGRRMTVLTEFEFIDSRGVRWPVARGAVVDGFSLPVLTWNPFVGTPFTGKGRRSSVVHDVYCQTKVRPYRDVHRAFHEGLIADGMSRFRAALYGKAVACFGPRWEVTNG